jgi:hypothetical protein
MQKKNLILVFILVLAAGLVFYPQLLPKAEAVNISDFNANLSEYLDKQVTISGMAAEVYDDENLILLVDEGGCCNVPILAPFTAEQQVLSGVDILYSGTLPNIGEYVETTGILTFDGQYYRFEVQTVTRNGDVIISKVS